MTTRVATVAHVRDEKYKLMSKHPLHVYCQSGIAAELGCRTEPGLLDCPKQDLLGAQSMGCCYRGKLQTDCFDVAGQSSCFVDKLDTPVACKPVGKAQTNITQPLQDMLSDGSASDGSDGSICKLYEDAGADIGGANITACTQGLVCTPLQVCLLMLWS